jgi:hypothetical protein
MPPSNPPAQMVLRFLESVGKRSEAEFYLRLFRDLPKPSFAVIAAEAGLVENALPSLVDGLRFLSALDLHAVVLLGLFDPSRDAANLADLVEGLRDNGLPCMRYSGDLPVDAEDLAKDLNSKRIPVVWMNAARLSLEERFAQTGAMVGALGTRKVVVLRARGGLHLKPGAVPGREHLLEVHDGQVSTINWATDRPALAGLLEAEDETLLSNLGELLNRGAQGGLAVSIASPLELLRELFTVRGSGTLVKRGSELALHQGYAGLDVTRLERLLSTTFGRKLRPGYFDEANVTVVLEAAYRGVAIVKTDGPIPYLSKFAVEQAAQGEGMGRDLWAALARTFPEVYWRARPQNPALDWYHGLCDGMVKSGKWIVFFRGIDEAKIGEVVKSATRRPDDFSDG